VQALRVTVPRGFVGHLRRSSGARVGRTAQTRSGGGWENFLIRGCAWHMLDRASG
jgi:hypothetical protein